MVTLGELLGRSEPKTSTNDPHITINRGTSSDVLFRKCLKKRAYDTVIDAEVVLCRMITQCVVGAEFIIPYKCDVCLHIHLGGKYSG